MKTHVTGVSSVLSHGHNLAWTFIALLRWPADANPTINVLLTVVRDTIDQVCYIIIFEWIMLFLDKYEHRY